MQVNFIVEEKSGSSVVLKVTISKDETKRAYKEKILEIQKGANLNGFRKGKVPLSVLESKFKESILAECVTSLIDKAFKEIYDKIEDDKKPAHFSKPSLLEATPPSLDEDIVFEVAYDIIPKIKYKNYKDVNVIQDDVLVTEEDINKEIELLSQEFITIEVKDGDVDKNDIVLVSYVVKDENKKEIDKKENEHINIAKNYNYYKIGNELIGHKKGDEFSFEKSYKKDDIESLANKKFLFDVKIVEVKREVIPELTDEFVQTIDEGCNSVENLKNKTKENLSNVAKEMQKEKTLQKVMDDLIETFEGDIPDTMIEYSKNIHIEEIKNTYNGDNGFKHFLNSKKQTEDD